MERSTVCSFIHAFILVSRERVIQTEGTASAQVWAP